MKKLVLNLVALSLITLTSFAQAPDSLNYQAVVRDVSGNIVANQTVGMQISILEGSTSGTAVYVETHTPATNDFGLVDLPIGGGNVVSGNFSSIDWGGNKHFVKVELDPAGGTYLLYHGNQPVAQCTVCPSFYYC